MQTKANYTGCLNGTGRLVGKKWYGNLGIWTFVRYASSAEEKVSLLNFLNFFLVWFVSGLIFISVKTHLVGNTQCLLVWKNAYGLLRILSLRRRRYLSCALSCLQVRYILLIIQFLDWLFNSILLLKSRFIPWITPFCLLFQWLATFSSFLRLYL